ncbi:branched-chain amino acid ABC transporter permease [Rhodobacteraceae bacterium CCMM004]|nr:branched-chain amino acid ABC transporter permease [Rhodobacteraceae bacterium CCMM004]
MAGSTGKTQLLRGALAGLPFVPVVSPFAVLFGALAAEAGLDLAATVGFSTVVIAGAAQFAALQLLVEGAAMGAIVATALAVNLRMAMYSAALVPHVGTVPLWQRALIAHLNFDQTFAASVVHYEAHPAMTPREKAAYFLGVAGVIAPCWVGFTILGALAGSRIPESWALDFALPITFLAMIGPMLKTPAHAAAAAVSVIVALALAGLPSGLGLLIAGGAAMATGAAVESLSEGRAA